MKLLTLLGDLVEIRELRDRLATVEGENTRLKDTLRSVDLATEREINELEAENTRLRKKLCEVTQ